MKRSYFILSILLALSMLLSACGGQPAATQAPAAAATSAPATAATEVPATAAPASDPNALPRNETLYFNGQQWNAVACWNPYSSSCNNAMAIAQGDNARVTMFETPYLYNMLDGKQYPLLADGDFTWDEGMTQLTFKIKPAAKWSDGTPVTAEDVAYTWATHVKYSTPTAAGNVDYIDTIEALDPQTVVIKAKLGDDGKALTRCRSTPT
jgi:peptide/nickel transport system substrate-binding protein